MYRALSLLTAALAVSVTAAPRHHMMARNPKCGSGGGNNSTQKTKVFIGSPANITVADFDGSSFTIKSRDTRPGEGPSWLLFQAPNRLYAVDENGSNNTRLFNYNVSTDKLTLVQNATGASGIVHLEFSADKSHIVASSFGQGLIEVFQVNPTDGFLTLVKQIASPGTPGPRNDRLQTQARPHQAVLDPSGQFFAVNDLGTDEVVVLDSQEGRFDIVNRVKVDAGCGPRHGAFLASPGDRRKASHYYVVCEIANQIKTFSLSYAANKLDFTLVDSISTFGEGLGPANPATAAAGELIVTKDGKSLFVSNRLTGNETDSISSFTIGEAGQLAFAQSISSGGKIPRMFSLSPDAAQSTLISTNQQGELGLLALPLAQADSALQEAAASLTNSALFGENGPQFAQAVRV